MRARFATRQTVGMRAVKTGLLTSAVLMLVGGCDPAKFDEVSNSITQSVTTAVDGVRTGIEDASTALTGEPAATPEVAGEGASTPAGKGTEVASAEGGLAPLPGRSRSAEASVADAEEDLGGVIPTDGIGPHEARVEIAGYTAV